MTKPQIAWIAGVGESAGTGAAVARRFAREGFTVVVTGRTQARLEARVAEIRNAGGQAIALPADVSSEEQVKAAIARVIELGHKETF